MPVKPEDVTEEHIKQIKDYLESQINWPLMPDNSQLATLANALIQAGIVSPPVYAIQHNGVNTFGLFSNENATTFLKSFRHPEKYAVEHWKGQAE